VHKLLNRFQEETEETIQVLQMRSEVFQTAKGEMEASISGSGPPVLVVHGAAGGFDQGEVKSEEFSGVQYISVSRPGYLRTPLETGKTPEEQADALAALLDTLGIQKAGFIGTSTGGLVGIYFALRHPERCSALVLVSSVNAPLPSHLSHYGRFSPLLQADFLPWALFHSELFVLTKPTLRKQVTPNPDKMSIIEELVQTAYPTSLRLSGMLNDAYQIDHQGYIPLEEIRVPTLVIHGTADDVVPFEQGVNSAARIPGAKFLPVYEGTHYCVLTHLEVTRPAIMEFLDAHPSK
jgi:pimeloyl-ACP methyl ester carboxylesterase